MLKRIQWFSNDGLIKTVEYVNPAEIQLSPECEVIIDGQLVSFVVFSVGQSWLTPSTGECEMKWTEVATIYMP